MANAKHILDKVKEIQKLANDVGAACKALIEHPDLNEVTDFANMLQAFATGQAAASLVPAKPKGTRVRRTRAQIEAEEAATKAGEGK